MIGALGVGCGQCIPCRVHRRRVWATRILLESLTHEFNAFVTLTYSDEHLPDPATVDPRALQLFLKRLRKLLAAAGRRLRFYAVGEYGDLTARPHYHLAGFGLSPLDAALVQRAWSVRGTPLGHVHLGELNWKTASYIARYTMKKLDEHSAAHPGLHPVFARMSTMPGIGSHAARTIAASLPPGQDCPSVIRVEGKHLPIGRYIRSIARDQLDEHVVQASRDLRSSEASSEVLALWKVAIRSSPLATLRSVILERDHGAIIRQTALSTLKSEGKL